MALKFDMGNSSWARQMAHQQQQQMLSAFGKDMGTGLQMGVSGLMNKAKAKFGAKYAKALEDKTTEAGSPSEFRTELNKQNRQTKLYNKFKDNEDLNSAYESKLQQHSDLMSTRNSHSRTSFPEKADWIKDRISSGQHKDILREARGGRRKEWFKDNFGRTEKMSDETARQLYDRPHQNLSRKDKQSLLDKVKYEGGEGVETAAIQAQNDAEQEALRTGSTEEVYDATGKAVTFGKTQDDYYNTIPSQSGIRGMPGKQKNLGFTSPLTNPNLDILGTSPYQADKDSYRINPSARYAKVGEEDVSGQEQREYSQEMGEREIDKMIQQADSDDGSTPDIQDILYEVDDLPDNVEARQKIIDDNEARQQEAWDSRLNEPRVGGAGQSFDYEQTNRAKLGRFGEALGETVQGYGGVLGDVLNQGKKAGQYVWDAPNVEKFVKHPAREAYRDLRNTTDDIYDAYDDTDVLGYWKNVWNNSNILGYNK